MSGDPEPSSDRLDTTVASAGPTVLLAGSAHPDLARAVAEHGAAELVGVTRESFPDGELHVAVDAAVLNAHVCILQPTGAPAERHLLELLLLADACRRIGARTITAIIPYFGYARQDRRVAAGDAVGLRVVSDVLAAGAVDRIVVVDPHAPTLEAITAVPVTTLSAVPTLAAALGPSLPSDAVLVAPDLGAVKLAERYAEELDLPVAIVRKARISGAQVQALTLVGDVDGRAPVIVDDMISTGATIAAAARVLSSAGAHTAMRVVVTHGVFADNAFEVLAGLPIVRLLVTDTLAFDAAALPCAEVVSVARLLGGAVRHLARHTSPAAAGAGLAGPGLLRHL